MRTAGLAQVVQAHRRRQARATASGQIVHHHHKAQLRAPLEAQRLQHWQQVGSGEQAPHLCILKDVIQHERREAGVDRHGYATGQIGGVPAKDEAGVVGHEQTDTVAFFQAQAQQTAGSVTHQIVGLGKSPRLVAKAHVDPVRIALCPRPQDRPQYALRQRQFVDGVEVGCDASHAMARGLIGLPVAPVMGSGAATN